VTASSGNGFTIAAGSDGLDFTVDQTLPADSSQKFTVRYTSYCQPITASDTGFYELFKNIDTNNPPSDTKRGDCLRALKCLKGTLPSIRRSSTLGPVSIMPSLPDLRMGALQKAIGHCLRIDEIIGAERKLHLLLDTIIYDGETCTAPSSGNQCYKVISKERTLSTKNTAGVRLLP